MCSLPGPAQERILQWGREGEQGPGLFKGAAPSLCLHPGPASGLTSCFLVRRQPRPRYPQAPTQPRFDSLLGAHPNLPLTSTPDTPLQPPSGPSPLSPQMTPPSPDPGLHWVKWVAAAPSWGLSSPVHVASVKGGRFCSHQGQWPL